MGAITDYEELSYLEGAGGDAVRAQLAEPELPYETPADTLRRQDTAAKEGQRAFAYAEREKASSNRMKAGDFAKRGIPSYTDDAGDVAPVTDATGAPITKYDKRHNVGYDSTGAPVEVKYDSATGSPTVGNPFDAILPWTDPKTGDIYKKHPALPDKWVGQDDVIKQRNIEKQGDMDVAQAAAVKGQKLTLEEARLHREDSEFRARNKEFATNFGPIDYANPDESRKTLEAAFQAQYDAKDANRKDGWFSDEFTDEAKQRRAKIDLDLATALQDLDKLVAWQKTLNDRRNIVRKVSEEREALLQRRADYAERKLAGVIPGLNGGESGTSPASDGSPSTQGIDGVPDSTLSESSQSGDQGEESTASSQGSPEGQAQETEGASPVSTVIPGLSEAQKKSSEIDRAQAVASLPPAARQVAEPAKINAKGEVEPEGFWATVGRAFGTKIIPAVATAGGGIGGAALGALGANPVTVIAGDIAGGALAGTLANKAQRAVMGDKWAKENEAQMEANAVAHPIATQIGTIAPFLISLIGGGGGAAVKVGEKVLGKATTGVGKAAIEAGAKAPLVERLATHSVMGARAGASEGSQEKYAEGREDVSVIDQTVKSALQFGATGIIPGAKAIPSALAWFPAAKIILKNSLGRGVTDAAAMTLAGDLYDAGVHGKPFDLKDTAEKFAGDVPAFVVQNAIMGFLGHGMAMKRAKGDGESAPPAVTPENIDTRIEQIKSQGDGIDHSEELAALEKARAALTKDAGEEPPAPEPKPPEPVTPEVTGNNPSSTSDERAAKEAEGKLFFSPEHKAAWIDHRAAELQFEESPLHSPERKEARARREAAFSAGGTRVAPDAAAPLSATPVVTRPDSTAGVAMDLTGAKFIGEKNEYGTRRVDTADGKTFWVREKDLHPEQRALLEGKPAKDLIAERDQLRQSVTRTPTSQTDAAMLAAEKTRLKAVEEELAQAEQSAPPARAGVSPEDRTPLSRTSDSAEGVPSGKADAAPPEVAPSAPQSVQSTYADVVGDGGRSFAPSETLGVPRAQMPQVASEHRGAMANWLKGRGMKFSAEDVSPASLKPSQADFVKARVEKAASRAGEPDQRRILISSDDRVIDGHHQWLAQLRDHPDKPMPALRIDAPAEDILKQIHEFPSAGMEKAPDAAEVAPKAIREEPSKPEPKPEKKPAPSHEDDLLADLEKLANEPTEPAAPAKEAPPTEGGVPPKDKAAREEPAGEVPPVGTSNLSASVEKNIREAKMMDAKDPAGFLRKMADSARAKGNEEAAGNFEAAIKALEKEETALTPEQEAEQHAKMMEDREERMGAAKEGSYTLSEAIGKLGGLPSTARDSSLRGEVALLWDASKGKMMRLVRGSQKKSLDDVRGRLEQFGFKFETPDQMLSTLEDSILGRIDEPRGYEPGGEMFASKIEPTETPAFKAWFGESKVVDQEGAPLRVFNGVAYDPGDVYGPHKNVRDDGGTFGFFFTPDEAVAREYAGGEKGVVKDVFLKLKNPLDLRGSEQMTAGQMNEALKKAGVEYQLKNPNDGSRSTWALFTRTASEWSGTAKGNRPNLRELRDAIRKAGYDGVMFSDNTAKSASGKNTAYVAFEPTQIKSATRNSGAFDAKNPNIYASRTEPAFEPKLRAAYDALVKRDRWGLPAVSISALAKESGIPLADLKDQLLALHKQGRVVLSPSDWSLSSPEVRAGVMDVNGQKMTQVRPLDPEVRSSKAPPGPVDVFAAKLREAADKAPSESELDAQGKRPSTIEIARPSGAGKFIIQNTKEAIATLAEKQGVKLASERQYTPALKSPDGTIYTGESHPDAYAKALAEKGETKGERGFVTRDGKFISNLLEVARIEAENKRQEGLAKEHHDATVKAIEPLQQRFKGATIKVVGDLSDTPELHGRVDPSETHEELTDTKTGTVYVFTKNISSPQRGVEVALHGTIGHLGVEPLVGEKEFQQIAKTVLRDAPGLAEKIARSYTKKGSLFRETGKLADLTPEERATVAREYVARLAEKPAINPALWQRIVATVRRALKAMGIQKEWSNADIRDLLRRAAREVEAPSESAGGGIFGSTKDDTSTPAFKKWFGDSKVVDEDGKPIPVYHGTNDDFEAFEHGHPNKKDTGWLGDGFYFTNQERLARDYTFLKGGSGERRVIPSFLRLENPYRAKWNEKERIMLAERRGDKYAAQDRTAELIRQGHDGVIQELPNGAVEYVAFRPEQIKSATRNSGAFDPKNPNIYASVKDVPDVDELAPKAAAIEAAFEKAVPEARREDVSRYVLARLAELKPEVDLSEREKAIGDRLVRHMQDLKNAARDAGVIKEAMAAHNAAVAAKPDMTLPERIASFTAATERAKRGGGTPTRYFDVAFDPSENQYKITPRDAPPADDFRSVSFIDNKTGDVYFGPSHGEIFEAVRLKTGRSLEANGRTNGFYKGGRFIDRSPEAKTVDIRAEVASQKPPKSPLVSPEDPESSKPSSTSTKNAVMEAERVQRGDPPIVAEARQAHPEAVERAQREIADNPNRVQETIERLRTSDLRNISVEDEAVMLVEKAKLMRDRNALMDRAADKSATPEEQALARSSFKAIEERMAEIDEATKASGAIWGRMGALRQRMIREDFSLEAVERRVRAQKGAPLTPEESVEIKETVDKVQKAADDLDAREKELDEQAARNAAADYLSGLEPAPRASNAVMELAERIVGKLESAADAARARIKARMGKASAGVDPTVLYDVAVIGLSKLGRASLDFAKWSSAMKEDPDLKGWVEPYLDDAWKKTKELWAEEEKKLTGAQKETVRQARGKRQDILSERLGIYDGIKAAAKEGAKLGEGLDKFVKQLVKNYVDAGERGLENVTARVKEALEPVIPGIADRQIHDAFSDYGKSTPATTKEADVHRAQIRREAQLTSALGDVERGVAPQRTGKQRSPQSDAARQLTARLNEAKRRYNIQPADPAAALRSALDARKTYYRNRMQDLAFEIARKERVIREKSLSPTDAELESLKADYEQVKADHEAVFGKREMTDEQRLQQALKVAERNEKTAVKQLEDAKKGVFPDATGGSKPGVGAAPELVAIRARADAMRAEAAELRSQAFDLEANRREQSLKDQIEELNGKIALGAVEAKPGEARPEPSARAAELAAQRDKLNKIIAQLRRDADPKRAPDAVEARKLAKLQKEIDALQAKLDANDLSVKARGTPKTETAAVDAAMKHRAELAKLLAEARRISKQTVMTPEERALKAYKTRLAREEAQLAERHAKADKGDPAAFAKRVRKPLDISSDPAAVDAKRRVDKGKEQLLKKELAYKLAHRSKLEVARDTALEAMSLGRAVLLSADLGYMGLQEGTSLITHPLLVMKRLPAVMRAAWGSTGKAGTEGSAFQRQWQRFTGGDAALEAVNAGINLRESARNGSQKEAGIFIGNRNSTLTRMEESFRSRWADRIPLIAHSARAMTASLNLLRADLLDASIKAYGQGKTKLPPKTLKMLGNAVNIWTGRGAFGRAEAMRGALNHVFLAPGWVWSRFQILYGHTMIEAAMNKDPVALKLAAKHYLRWAAGMAALYGTLSFLYGDEPETDPRSSKFGMVKVGSKLFDFSAATISPLVFLSRMVTGQRLTNNGEVVQLRHQDGSTEKKKFGAKNTADLAFKFLQGKLAPVPGYALDVSAGEDIMGRPANWATALLNRTLPLTPRQMAQIYMEDNPDATEANAAALLQFIGINSRDEKYNAAESMKSDPVYKIVEGTKLDPRDKPKSKVLGQPRPVLPPLVKKTAVLAKPGSVTRVTKTTVPARQELTGY